MLAVPFRSYKLIRKGLEVELTKEGALQVGHTHCLARRWQPPAAAAIVAADSERVGGEQGKGSKRRERRQWNSTDREKEQ